MAAVCASYGWLTTTLSVQVPEFAGFRRHAPGMLYCGGMLVFASPGRLSTLGRSVCMYIYTCELRIMAHVIHFLATCKS